MTMIDNTRLIAETRGDVLPAYSSDAIGPATILRFLRFALPYLLVALLVTVSLATYYIINAKPVYTASARLLFDPKSIPSFDQTTRWLEPSAEMTTRIESQVEVIRSGLTARNVITRLKLVDDPEFQPTESRLSAILNFFQGRDAPSQRDEGNAKEKLRTIIETTVPLFLARLSVRRVGLSAAIEIAYRAGTPEKAALIANALARAYIEIGIQQKGQEARRGGVWLDERLAELRKQAFNAMRNVERFKVTGAGSASDSSVRKAELQSVADTYLKMYESFLLKSMETQQRVSYPVSDAHIVSAASPMFVSKSPKRGAILGFAVVCGVAIGLAIALAKLTLDGNVRQVEAVERMGLRVVGAIDLEPSLDRVSSGKVKRNGGSSVSRREAALAEIFGESALLQMRSVHGKLIKSLEGDSLNIGFVGVRDGCGATTTASKLAQIFAAHNRKTLLVDANSAVPMLTNTIAPESQTGLLDGLERNTEPCVGIISGLHIGFAFLPIGGRDSAGGHSANPRIGLSIKKDREVMRRLTSGFEVCLFDLPSADDTQNLRAFAPALDAVVLVAEFGVTKIDDLEAARDEIEQCGANLIGAVVTKVSDKRRLV